MTSGMTSMVCVVDANVALKLVLEQSFSDKADALFDRLHDEPDAQFHVPDLFYAEIASVLVLQTRLSAIKMPIYEAEQALANLKALNLMVTPSHALIETAFQIATQFRTSGYDAMYVALSDSVGAPLVTADEKLVSALKSSPYDVRWLGSL
jgi:predicted nucleic acid-binding protein